MGVSIITKASIYKEKKLENNKQETGGKMQQLKKIHARQAPRSDIGHWEVDTVIGKAHKSQILTFTERTSRFTLVQKLASKMASETAKEILILLKHLPKKLVKSITAGRGKEFHM